MAGGAGDGLVFIQRFPGEADQFHFLFVQRAEILHGFQVVIHLGQVAHTAEHGMNALQPGSEAQGPAGIGNIRAVSVKYSPHFRNGVGQDAALDRLHDHYRNPALAADLPVTAGGHTGVFPVSIVDLQLDKFRVRVGIQQPFQQGGIRVEGEAPVADQPFLLQVLYKVPKAVVIVFLMGGNLESVKQVVIKETGAGALQAGPEFLLGALFIGRADGGVDLGGQGIGVPGITIRHGGFEGFFAVAAVIDVGGVKIGAARGNETVSHFTDLGDVDASVRVFRQAHQAEGKTEGIGPEWFRHNRILSFSHSVVFIPAKPLYPKTGKNPRFYFLSPHDARTR